MQPGDPSQKTILVSGDVKRPVDGQTTHYPLYLRHRGHNAYNQGVTFWRPIPPKDYMHGRYMQNNPYNEKPYTDLIRCIPKNVLGNLKIFKIYGIVKHLLMIDVDLMLCVAHWKKTTRY